MEFIFFKTAIFTEICRCCNGEGAPLYGCFDFVDGKIVCICTPVPGERVLHSHHTRVHGVKFQSVVLPDGLIISLEGQWEGRRHDCVLCFMNWINLINPSGWHGQIIFVFIWRPCLTNLCTSAGPLPPRKLN